MLENKRKENAVRDMLDEEESRVWSDRAIARACGVSATFVGRLRRMYYTKTDVRKYISKHGSAAMMNTRKIGEFNLEAQHAHIPKKNPQSNYEKAVENKMVVLLQSKGWDVRTQVRCQVGIVDIVTDFGIFEVKGELTRRRFFTALGQVSLYREAIDPCGQAWIVGVDSGDEIADVVEYAQRLRIDVILFDRGDIDA